jgi:hypothetical protein
MSHAVQPKSRIQSTYQHASRPEWGAAVIAWEREGKRGYQFEDGQVRVFATQHYHLLDTIDVSADRMKTLMAILGHPPATVVESALPPAPIARPTLDEQVEYFQRAYRGGFAGDAWQNERRQASGPARKRHRDPAIAHAREQLTAERLAGWVERRKEQEAMEALTAVLGRTDLVAATRAQRLTDISPDRARGVLVGLFDLLFSRVGVEVRLMQWVQALTRAMGQAPTWSLATAPLALVEPDRFVCVHRTSFVAQGSVVTPRLKLATSPSGYAYTPVLAMVEQIRLRLVEAGIPPGDRFDVYDFICLTVGTEARRAITDRRKTASS